MKKLNITLLCALVLTTSLCAADEIYEKGKELYFQNGCGNCHGTNAEGSSYYPRLAYKKQKYLINKLQKFKKGLADTQKQEIMFTFAKPLTAVQIETISYYLSNFKTENEEKYKVEDDLLGVDY